MNTDRSFETTYIVYPFPVLVDFGMALGRLFARARRWKHETPNTVRETASYAR